MYGIARREVECCMSIGQKESLPFVGIATNWTMSIEQEWLFLKHARYSGALLCNKGLWHNKSALSVACIR